MPLSPEREQQLTELCRRFRVEALTAIHGAQSGHPGGSLSVCEILATLILNRMRNLDVNNPANPARDRLVLCKGHAAPMLYRVLAEKGFFPVEEMHTLRKLCSGCQLAGNLDSCICCIARRNTKSHCLSELHRKGL